MGPLHVLSTALLGVWEVLMNQLHEVELRPFLAEALNPDTPPFRLKMLALHKEWLVRSLVAKNPSTPARSIEILVKDSHPLVRDAAYYGRR